MLLLRHVSHKLNESHHAEFGIGKFIKYDLVFESESESESEYEYTNSKASTSDKERYTYKGHSYVIRTGKRGGKYILYNGEKKYI
jgi:hypothetical protein